MLIKQCLEKNIYIYGINNQYTSEFKQLLRALLFIILHFLTFTFKKIVVYLYIQLIIKIELFTYEKIII